MPTIAAAVATIHFIGIILFANDNGIHAIMPVIPDVQRRTTDWTYATADFKPDFQNLHFEEGSGKAPSAPQPRQAQAAEARSTATPTTSSGIVNAYIIETHTALIAFRSSDKIYSAWPVTSLDGKNAGWSYIQLHGEELTFDTLAFGVNNATPTQNPQLPKMQFNSQPAPALDARFRPPYSGAAGVIDIPRGSLSSCLAYVAGHQTTRADTMLTLNHNGVIVLRMSGPSSDPAKILVLRPSAEIYVANAPMAWITAFGHGPGSPDHWHAYYLMTNQPGNSQAPLVPMPNAICYSQFIPPGGGDGGPAIGSNAFVRMKALGGPVSSSSDSSGGGMSTLVSNAECSNTQWP